MFVCTIYMSRRGNQLLSPFHLTCISTTNVACGWLRKIHMLASWCLGHIASNLSRTRPGDLLTLVRNLAGTD